MVPLELAGVAARAHAGPVGIAVALVVLLVLVQAVERPGAGANQAADGRALAGVDLLVAASALLGRVLIAGFDGGLQRRLSRRRAHHPRRRGYLLACG